MKNTDADGGKTDDIVVRDTKGNNLFVLDDGNPCKLTYMTVREAYSSKIQWFEPSRDNFMRPIWTNPSISSLDGIKHFNWNDIVNYADNHQNLLGYAWNGAFNDWKSNSEGGDGFLLSTVSGDPYWTDAVGQVPYAINQVRANLKLNQNPKQAYDNTIISGKKYGGGLFGSADNGNSYDNGMIERGAKFAIQRFDVGKKTVKDIYIGSGVRTQMLEVHLKIRPINSNILAKPF